MPGWLRTWLVIAAIVGGAALLWVGLTFIALLIIVVAVPYWLWTLFVRSRRPEGSITIEGEVVKPGAPPLSIAPLTEEEKARLAATRVWVVWYEDQFHVGAERDSFGKAVCFSEEDARAWVARSGSHMLVSGFDGCEILGPENPLTTPLFGAQQAEIIGAILDRLERGSREPIPMRI